MNMVKTNSIWSEFSCANVIGIWNTTSKFSAHITANQAYGMMFGLGIFCAIVAKLLGVLRLKLYREKANVDRTFDAGGQLSMGLTASTVISEWTWPADFVKSSLFAVKYGISGIYWNSCCATVIFSIFSILCIELKIRAPGAKTYLEVIRARFGRTAHITFCIYALFTNVILINSLLIEGCGILSQMVENLPQEYIATMILIIIAIYCLLGGVGATSYVSFFYSIMMMIGVTYWSFIILNEPIVDKKQTDSTLWFYQLVSCNKTEENKSYFSFQSEEGFKYGILNMIGLFSLVLMDQAFWQRSVAAKPREGAWGFLVGGIIWFSLPFSCATIFGFVYAALGTLYGQPLLTHQAEENGFIPIIVLENLFESSDSTFLASLIIVAISTTGAAEILAIVSILVYDVYAVYINPFRPITATRKCLLCDKEQSGFLSDDNVCQCEPLAACIACEEEDKGREISAQPIKKPFKCKVHGNYRIYNEQLENYKNWAIVIVTGMFLPMTIIAKSSNVDGRWLLRLMVIIISSATFPQCLSMWWTRLSGVGVVIGMIGGSLCGISSWLIICSQMVGGFNSNTFIENSGSVDAMLTGTSTSIVSGLLISLVVSYMTKPNYEPDIVWKNMLDINNPLTPWQELYVDELCLNNLQQVNNRPSRRQMQEAFRKTRWSVIIAAFSITTIFLLIGPLILVQIDEFSYSHFYHWITAVQVLMTGSSICVIVIPVISELRNICKKFHVRNMFGSLERVIDVPYQQL